MARRTFGIAALVAILGVQVAHARAAEAGEVGARLAKAGNGTAPACIACHGAAGEGTPAAGYPRLAGLGTDYLIRQLQAFAEGTRKSAVMAPIAKALTAGEARAAAAYFASLAPGPARPRPESGPGARLALRGRWEGNLPACEQCHGPDAVGVGDAFPPLQGQPTAYIAEQLGAWKAGTRPPGPLGLMQAIAQKLSPQDIGAVAHYYGGGAAASAPASADNAAPAVPQEPSPRPGGFTPPPESAIPDDDFGRLVRLGERIFTDTKKHAPAYVGNDLRCSNCHLDAGRLAHSAPLWGAYVAYPKYRAKTRKVDSYDERLQGCFQYSMNGKAPPLGSEILDALQTYSYWLATGAPVNTAVEGAGYPKLARPAGGPRYDRGKRVYEEHCALCHGAGGEGQRSGDVQVFPPLWGPRSFNWGAGMHQLNNAAAFIKANMPLGRGGTLTDEQAWDVAYYMNAHERPQDPRFKGSIAETRKRYHDSPDSLYGVVVKGRLLGAGTAQQAGGNAARKSR